MQLRLKTKFTLTTALLVLAVVALTSSLYVATLVRQVVREADERARFVAQQVFLQAQHALADAAQQGAAPASGRPEDLREYVRKALDENVGLTSLIDATVGYSPIIYEVTITDVPGVALISSDASLVGRRVWKRTPLAALTGGGLLEQIRALYGAHRVYEVTFPFNVRIEAQNAPFGDIRVVLSTAFLRYSIAPNLRYGGFLALAAVLLSTLLAALVSHVALAPLARISAQLDRISQGEFEAEPAPAGQDELGQVSSKINLIGQQLRDVREIFSTLRQNLSQIMAGLQDGLLLFTGDGRAVLASPAVEKFLGAKPDALLGRRVSEIFPLDHPLRRALCVKGDQLEPVEPAEVHMDGAAPGAAERIGVSVQVISEKGTRMGALVTLHDLDSLEQLDSQLQVSERLAALGRVTAGVAHEVKNPLNAMRLWLEHLKESLPADQETPQQAVRILDSEINRLDRVVKTFLDFTRPVELELEETDLSELLREAMAIARPQLERGRVALTADLASADLRARVDRALIRQAALNLLFNACQAMPEGGQLHVGLRRRGEFAEVSVADTGGGIAPEHRAKIFQLFFTTHQGGTGIGLATTFRIVQLHNGSIDFESEVGRGTTFRIELPLAH